MILKAAPLLNTYCLSQAYVLSWCKILQSIFLHGSFKEQRGSKTINIKCKSTDSDWTLGEEGEGGTEKDYANHGRCFKTSSQVEEVILCLSPKRKGKLWLAVGAPHQGPAPRVPSAPCFVPSHRGNWIPHLACRILFPDKPVLHFYSLWGQGHKTPSWSGPVSRTLSALWDSLD